MTHKLSFHAGRKGPLYSMKGTPNSRLVSVLVFSAVAAAFGISAACGPTPTKGDGQPDASVVTQHDSTVQDGDGSVPMDGPALFLDGSGDKDAGNAYVLDAAVDPDGCPPEMRATCDNPVDPGCQNAEICDNGLDDDCNGQIDDGCSCRPGDVQPCFQGPPGYANVGGCTMGTQTCEGTTEFGHWGPCEGGIFPTPEVCDALDNDCNGCADDGLCCAPEVTCPEPGDIAEAQPFTPYQIDGTQWYSGPAQSWSWEVEGGPCDQVLGTPSFTITGADTATPTLQFTLSGDYTVTMTVTTATDTYTCTFIVHVVGPGLRVELCWEGTGSRDIDLHLLRSDFDTQWCDTNYDCFYMNCKGSNWDLDSWGYSDGPLAECVNSPNGQGANWQARGSCANPRLDVDNISTPGIPENINVDAPTEGQNFRVMVHYYSGSGEAHPLVNIYCDGHRIATYGQSPSLVTGFSTSGGFGCQGDTWRVADVVTHVNGNQVSCDVTALHPNGQQSGYRVLRDDTSY